MFVPVRFRTENVIFIWNVKSGSHNEFKKLQKLKAKMGVYTGEVVSALYSSTYAPP